MPVSRMGCRESPGDALQGQSGLYMVIFGHILLVIVDAKFMGSHLSIDGKCGDDEEDADQEIAMFVEKGGHFNKRIQGVKGSSDFLLIILLQPAKKIWS